METNKKFHYLLKISYDGSEYLGWQIQNNGKTIQQELNKALEKISKADVRTTGAGRTDTGVHALGQMVKVTTELLIDPSALVRGLNSLLPMDIRALECSVCEENFLPTSHALSKSYFYLFSNTEEERAFQNRYMANISYELDFEKMKEACNLFVGKHDFKDFQVTGSEVKTTVREIFHCELTGPYTDTLSGIFPSYYRLDVTGNGFLKQMIRLMVGCLWDVGRSKVSLEELQEALKKPQGRRFGKVAPACGLYKSTVSYV